MIVAVDIITANGQWACQWACCQAFARPMVMDTGPILMYAGPRANTPISRYELTALQIRAILPIITV